MKFSTLLIILLFATGLNAQICNQYHESGTSATDTEYPRMRVGRLNQPLVTSISDTLKDGGTPFNFSLTQDTLVGYHFTRYLVDNDRKIRILNRGATGTTTPLDASPNSPDEFTYTLTLSNVPNNKNARVRLYQIFPGSPDAINSEYSTYTVTWKGGDPSEKAVYHDAPANSDTTDATTTYYAAGHHTGFNLDNRQIGKVNGVAGSETSNTGELDNGDFFNVYHIKNVKAEWYVEFPIGVTSVTVNKKVIVLPPTKGGTPLDSDGTVSIHTLASSFAPTNDTLSNPANGIGASYPAYGNMWKEISGELNKPGESFHEAITFQVSLVECVTFRDLVLPVELGDFKAKTIENGAELTWTTLSEINHSHFDLERSFDAENFEAIHRADGTGDSNEKKTYSYTDKNIPAPIGTKVYYRLKQVDYDGTTTYSDMVYIISEGNNEVKVAPNPVTTGNFTIYAERIQTIDIYNTFGQLVFRRQIDNESQYMIDTQSFSAGIYILVVNGKTSKKIIVSQ